MPKFLNVLNMNENEIQNFAVHNTSSGINKAGAIILDGTALKYHNGSGYVTLTTSTGDITSVTITTDSGGGSAAQDDSGDAAFSILGGNGIGVTNSGATITVALDAANTTNTSILNSSFTKIGTASDEEYIKFDTSNEVNVHINDTERLSVTASGIDVTGTITGDTSLTLDTTTITTAELGVLDSVTAGTAAASKAVVLDASKNIATIGTIGCGAITSTGTSSFATAIRTPLIEYTDGDDAITIADGGGITAAAGITSTAAANTFGATSFNDANITNVADIALDTISHDDNTIGVSIKDNTDTAFSIKQGSDVYFDIDTRNGAEIIDIGTDTDINPTINLGTATSTVAVAKHLTVGGNLTVTGTTTTVNQTNLDVSDNIIGLNRGASTNANDSGLIIERGSTGNNAAIIWDESDDKFVVGTTTATPSDTGDLTITTGTLVANIEGNVTGNLTGNADTVTTNANLTGDVTSSGNATTIAAAAVHHSMLAEDIISGQSELAHADIADGDDLMIHDASASEVLKVGVDSLRDHFFAAISGDATVADGGALTIAAGAVENSMLADDAVGADELASNAVVNASISSSAAIAISKLADQNDQTILGNNAGSAAAPTALTMDNLRAMLGKKAFILNDSVSGVAVSNSNKTYTITHGLGNGFNYGVEVIRNSANSGGGETVFTDVTRTSTTIVINFSVAPTAGDYTALVNKF